MFGHCLPIGVQRVQKFGTCWGCPDAVILGWIGAATGIVTGCSYVNVVAACCKGIPTTAGWVTANLELQLHLFILHY